VGKVGNDGIVSLIVSEVPGMNVHAVHLTIVAADGRMTGFSVSDALVGAILVVNHRYFWLRLNLGVVRVLVCLCLRVRFWLRIGSRSRGLGSGTSTPRRLRAGSLDDRHACNNNARLGANLTAFHPDQLKFWLAHSGFSSRHGLLGTTSKPAWFRSLNRTTVRCTSVQALLFDTYTNEPLFFANNM
jgi:hypothetical protein